MRVNKFETNNEENENISKEKNHKIGLLLNSESFLSRLVTSISKHDIKDLFSDYNITISDKDIDDIEKSISYSIRSNKELPEIYLSKVSAGKSWFSESYFGIFLKSQIMSPFQKADDSIAWEVNPQKITDAVGLAIQGYALKTGSID